MHVCVGESAYLFTIKKFPCVFCIFTRKKKRKQNPQSIHLFCTNYSYLRRTGYTQTPVHVCVYGLYVYACACISGNSLAFPYFKQPGAIQRTRPSPTWLPLMFRINHWVVRACMFGGEGSFRAHSEEQFKPMTPLIKASHYNTNKQSKHIHTSIC